MPLMGKKISEDDFRRGQKYFEIINPDLCNPSERNKMANASSLMATFMIYKEDSMQELRC
jgi:hypothetical protein